ncbi:MAG: hypothetical protein ABI317_01275, partial [Gaiellales bacterium]
MTIDTAFPSTPTTGATVELRSEGGPPLPATVVETLETSLLLGGLTVSPHPSTSLTLRWFTGETGAWEIDVELARSVAGPGQVAV